MARHWRWLGIILVPGHPHFVSHTYSLGVLAPAGAERPVWTQILGHLHKPGPFRVGVTDHLVPRATGFRYPTLLRLFQVTVIQILRL